MIEGNIILVTGMSRGIGAAIAAKLEAEGAIVVGTARGKDFAETFNGEARQRGSRSRVFETDVTDGAAVERLFQEIDRRYGRIDALVNNAGIAAFSPFLDTPAPTWKSVIETNLTAVYEMTFHAVRRMVAVGNGQILFIASDAAVRGIAQMAAYCASKHGVLGLARALQEELQLTGIRISTLMPGPVSTTILGSSSVSAEVLQPEDIAASVYHVLSLSRSAEIRELLIQPSRLTD